MKDNQYSNLYEVTGFIEQNRGQDDLDLGQIKTLMNDKMNLRIVPKNKRIFYSGHKTEYVYFIICGSYFNYRISSEGKMHILGRENGPQWLGIDRAVNSGNVNLTENKTLEECVVLEVKTSYFVSAIENSGEFGLYIVKNILNKMMDISGKSDRLLFNDGREHLIFFILKFWHENNHNKAECRIDMKNTLIAEEMGVHIRTLYRALSVLKEEGLIAVKKRNIVVTMEQIQKMDQIIPYFSAD